MNTSTGSDRKEKTPTHVAVIMDGNGRWAKSRGLPRVAGHRKGVETITNLLPICSKRKIPYLTLFAFSSENWKRPPAEVKLLIELLTSTLESEMRKLNENGIRLRVIGDIAKFPERLQARIKQTCELTKSNNVLHLTIAINYGGQWDVTQACKAILDGMKSGALSQVEVTPSLIDSFLSTKDLPEPDLFIRTGGEKRISNFLLWQLAYTELYFTDTYWPDFNETSFDDTLNEFAGRQRRFGKTGEQMGGPK
ncbi:MAG: di-trans,poly-cis-decaprenylcistransferase [Gammaproteobacteria bacterium]|nr:di-trans,poly-cis-decaprenylcistransferase [Gammaproteobacteria bacterium]